MGLYSPDEPNSFVLGLPLYDIEEVPKARNRTESKLTEHFIKSAYILHFILYAVCEMNLKPLQGP